MRRMIILFVALTWSLLHAQQKLDNTGVLQEEITQSNIGSIIEQQLESLPEADRSLCLNEIMRTLKSKYGDHVKAGLLNIEVNTAFDNWLCRERAIEQFRSNSNVLKCESQMAKSNASSAMAVNVQDSLTLVALYNATGGDAWNDNSNWLSGPVDTWYGITVIGDRVAHIELAGNNLQGEIPSALGNLDAAGSLELNNNFLTGTIPEELGNMTNLWSLDLGNNQLTGTIPNSIWNITQIHWILLYQNQLSGSIPADVGNLINLDWLSLNDNALSGPLPAEMGNLDSLKYLQIWNNQFSGEIPTSFGNLGNLRRFQAGGNAFSGSIPAELGSCSNLEIFQFWGNQLSGTIPAEIGNLSKLELFDVWDNDLSGAIPEAFWNCTNLTYLDLDGNQFSCPISSNIGNLTLLETCYMGSNGDKVDFYGSLPTTLGNLSSIQTLCIYNTNISGPIPAELGGLNTVIELDLHNNDLAGTIPSELGNLSSVQNMYLSHNQLSGELPVSLASLPAIGRLYLHYNQLTELPDFSALSPAVGFAVLGNKLTFEDLEPNVGLNIFYSPQDSVETSGPSQVDRGRSFTLSVEVGGTANQYQWFKNDTLIAGATETTYTVKTADLADAGVYHCEVTNTLATALTIYSHKKRLSVASPQVIAVFPERHDFGQVILGGEKSQEIVIYNLGNEDLIIRGLTICGVDSSAFGLSEVNMPLTIRGNWQAIVTAKYQPQAPGSHEAALRFISNCSQRPDLQLPLKGACQIDDAQAPMLVQAFPVPGSQAVPQNVALKWQIRDDEVGKGLDGASIQLSVNDVPIVTGGVDVTGGFAKIQNHNSGLQIQYQPQAGFEANASIQVHLTASDLAYIPNVLDTTYVLHVCGATVVTASVDTVGVSGGTVVDDSLDVQMVIPANALTDSTEIIISQIENPPALPDTVSGLGLNLHFWPDGLQFNEPVTLSIPYTQALLDSAGVTEPMDLAVYYFLSSRGEWVRLTIQSATATHLLVQITEFCYLMIAKVETSSTAVPGDNRTQPLSLALNQNYPNPFNPKTKISFHIPRMEQVSLIVYDIQGRMVDQLVNRQLTAGKHEVVWHGTNRDGNSVASGVYVYVLQVGDRVMRKKCLFLK